MRGGDTLRPAIPANTEALSLLINYVALDLERADDGQPRLCHLMASHIYDLMALTVGAPGAREAAQGGGVPAARLHAIKQDT